MNYPTNLSESDRCWYDLIQQCRTSGKSDRQWLLENNICSSTFYYHVKQLHKKACDIPESTCNVNSQVQEVVPLVIDDMPLSNPQTVSKKVDAPSDEIVLRLTVQGATMEITNQTTQTLIQNVFHSMYIQYLTFREKIGTGDYSSHTMEFTSVPSLIFTLFSFM